MPKSEKGHNSVYFPQYFMKCLSGHLHHVPKLFAWYHDPSSNGSPDILFTMLLYYTKCQSRKREIIQSNIYRILPKVDQVTYSLDTIYESNSVIPAQSVLHILCSQGPLWVKCLCLKRGIIQSSFVRILWKGNQVIDNKYLNCIFDFMILVQKILQLFCSQCCFTIENANVQKGRSFQIFTEFCQMLIRSSTTWLQSVSQISWS